MLTIALAIGVAYVVASEDWCRRDPEKAPIARLSASGEGELWAGAGQAPLDPPFPVVKAGYPPPRAQALGAAYPLRARAVVIQVQDVKIAIATVDLLLIPHAVLRQVIASVGDLGLTHLWLVATHTHSSMGGFDARPIAEVAATGRYAAASEMAVVLATAQALRTAAASMVRAELAVGEGRFPNLVTARSEGLQPDGRLTRISIGQETTGPLAQVVVFAAHPTLISRQQEMLDPDYPGLFSAEEERAGRGLTVFVQGAIGNASVATGGEDAAARLRDFTAKLRAAAAQVTLVSVANPSISLRTVSANLPNPDASRLVPPWLQPIGRNLLCPSAPRQAEISQLSLGPVKLLFVPGEPTAGAELKLLEASGAQRTVALANGYLGYIETPELVLQGKGESKRQYFGPQLLEVLSRASQRTR
ncbi:MAG TPA: neutral/alkaline non-lysosomal ceramidase N-terminal domain-containing protein [Myxococcaceae bacterium]|nr:neutral/alkaline non-lysosomal ceramidase N-terminal domain-containing protein [Myxococcaceae bacterium]